MQFIMFLRLEQHSSYYSHRIYAYISALHLRPGSPKTGRICFWLRCVIPIRQNKVIFDPPLCTAPLITKHWLALLPHCRAHPVQTSRARWLNNNTELLWQELADYIKVMNETFLSDAGATEAFSLTANNQAGSKAENEVRSHFKTACSESIQINGLQRVLPNGFNHCISSFKCSAAKVTVQTLSERRECKVTASFKQDRKSVV